MCVVAAVPVRNLGYKPLPIFAGVQINLCNARKILAYLVTILGHTGSQSVKPDLLVEIHIRFRPFASVWIASVENPRTIRRPGSGAATRRVLHSRNAVVQFLAGSGVEEVKSAILTTIFGE